MKDNKIDIMCKKIGDIIMEIHNIHRDGEWAPMDSIEKALRVLQTDLEILRKCTIDNPNYKWSDNQSK